MKKLSSFIVFTIVCITAARSFAADGPPGDIRLLPGYKHQRLQGIDSIPGKISKAGGLEINYDIGRVSKPGAPRLGGDFSDQAKRIPPAQRSWYREQVIGGQPVHLALTKRNMLLVSFPNSGANFSASIKSNEDLADALLMLLSHQAKKPLKRR